MGKIFLLILAALSAFNSYAQQPEPRKVQVRVVDRNNQTITETDIYAFVKNNPEDIFQLGENGSLVIAVDNPDDTLCVVLGNNIMEIPVSGAESIDILMKNKRKVSGYREDESTHINTGYNLVPLRSNTIAANAVNVKTIGNYNDLASYMAGRVAGVEVINAGGNVDLRIRGVGSINSGTGPLIILDGMPQSNFAMVNATLRPSEVESITVLKDGTIYGVRGANGVVIITTRGSGSR